MTPEGKVKKKIVALLKRFGAWYFAHVSIGMGKHGVPDYVCCVPVTVTQDMVGRKVGLFVAIEAKRDDIDEPSKLQREQMKAIIKASGIAVLVNAVRLPSLEALLKKLTRSEHEKSSSASRTKGARRRST